MLLLVRGSLWTEQLYEVMVDLLLTHSVHSKSSFAPLRNTLVQALKLFPNNLALLDNLATIEVSLPDYYDKELQYSRVPTVRPSVLSDLAAEAAAPTSGKDRDLAATDCYRYIGRQI